MLHLTLHLNHYPVIAFNIFSFMPNNLRQPKALSTTKVGWVYGKGRLSKIPPYPTSKSAFGYLFMKDIAIFAVLLLSFLAEAKNT